MKLFDYIDKDEFEACVNAGYIMINYHPTVEGLRIICYTQTCNSDKYWNKTTVACRGLIVDKDDNIIARPFKKFFNYEEHEVCENILKPKDIDELAFDWTPEVYEKLDGSLGILYWVGNVPYIATKGSFTSPQALHATHLLHTKYRDSWDKLLRTKTYLFEIIYPEDLHVVTYKDVDDIFLLAIISTENNFEYPVELMKKVFPVVKKYYLSNWKECRQLVDGTNREGFVIKIGPLRIKMKYEEYWRLHYLKAGLSEKMIRRCLVDGDMSPVNEALTMFDEEHVLYYKRIMDKYTDKYSEIIDKCLEEYRNDFETQKNAAAYFFTCKYPHILLRMYKGQNYEQITWKYVMKEIKNTTDELED